jgi:cytochrome c6
MQNKVKRVPVNLKIVSFLIFVLFGIVACQSGSPKKKTGFDIYRSNCITCHGANGRMGINGAKELPSSPLPVEQRIEVISNGRNSVMPSFKNTLTEAQIKLVAEYTMTMK